MSRPVSRHFGSSVALACCLFSLAPPRADAQTIADYSHAQRLLLESAMSQAATRAAAQGGAAPVSSSAAAAAPSTPAPTPAPMRRPAAPTSASFVRVNGVFAARGGAIVEIVVDATAYLLRLGEQVPGTAWRIDAVAVDQVVLGQRGRGAGGGGPGERRVFTLPALH